MRRMVVAGGPHPFPFGFLGGASIWARLLKKTTRPLLLAAVREAVGAGIYKLEYLLDLLREDHGLLVVRPQDPRVAQITYADRSLEDYDELI